MKQMRRPKKDKLGMLKYNFDAGLTSSMALKIWMFDVIGKHFTDSCSFFSILNWKQQNGGKDGLENTNLVDVTAD